MSLADLLADTARCALETGDLEPLRNALRAYDAAEGEEDPLCTRCNKRPGTPWCGWHECT